MHLSTEHEKIHITKYLWSAPRLYISFSSVINGAGDVFMSMQQKRTYLCGFACVVALHYCDKHRPVGQTALSCRCQSMLLSLHVWQHPNTAQCVSWWKRTHLGSILKLTALDDCFLEVSLNPTCRWFVVGLCVPSVALVLCLSVWLLWLVSL